MRTTLRSVAALDAGERWLLLEAALVVGVVRLGLRFLPFRSLRRGIGRLTQLPRSEEPPPERLAWAVGVASRTVPGGDTCLVRAVAAAALLARRGQPAVLRFGVERDGGTGLRAHAWVESGGRTVVGGAGAYENRLPPLAVGRP